MHSHSAAQVAVLINQQRSKTTHQECRQGYISSALNQPFQRPFAVSSDVKSAWAMSNDIQSIDNPNHPQTAVSEKNAGHGDQQNSKANAAYQRWISKNQDDDSKSVRTLDSRLYPNSSAANIVLYVGFALTSIGLIMTFVSIGDRGIQTQELKLIGPSLIGSGLLFCLLRIFFCSLQASCNCCDKKEGDEKKILDPPDKANDTDTKSAEPARNNRPKLSVPKKMKSIKIHTEETVSEGRSHTPTDPPGPTDAELAGSNLAVRNENVRAEVHQYPLSSGIEMAVISPLAPVDRVHESRFPDVETAVSSLAENDRVPESRSSRPEMAVESPSTKIDPVIESRFPGLRD